MAEVKEKCYAGPFKKIPFKNFIQLPIGLVSKAGNKNKTRQIFHLSYNFKNGNKSLNFHTPKEKCSIKYNDLDHAVRQTLKLCCKFRKFKVRYAKTDLQSAFRILSLQPGSFPWLVFKAENPDTSETLYFVDKCLPFGASISCSHCQHFCNVLKHILEYRINKNSAKFFNAHLKELIEFITNYLDDFLFIAFSVNKCNKMVAEFTKLCNELGVPIAHDKMELGAIQTTFLGMLLDGDRFLIMIPVEKQMHALDMLNKILDSKKATLKEVEKLAGYLNFLNCAIVSGRVFTCRMYAKFTTS